MKALVESMRSVLRSRSDLALENLALRQQLALFREKCPSPRLARSDRVFWVVLQRLWQGWRRPLCLVQPATVVKWHRMGFRLFWHWKSRSRVGRPRATPELRALIRRMADANPTWGAPRIHGELLRLGMEVGQTTVARYMPRPGRGAPKPSPRWRNFLRLQLVESAGMDFFAIPTATFGVLLGFVVVSHRDRRILHLNVTAHPTEEWTKQQLREAFPWTSAPRYLHRDRDKLYSEGVRATLTHLGIREVPSAARCPWQNPYAERVIGSIRRELLDHVVVLIEAHARRLLREYQRYYNGNRPTGDVRRMHPSARAAW
ncbi:integrase core domain-containing protein [Myxococcus fulvus]|uniref:integrase core domain-containing protein n=1 Tax=Myxococcus fulvus TaxID=33 RepID=UPI003B9D4EFB